MSFLRKRKNSPGFNIHKEPKVVQAASNSQYDVFLSFCGEDTRRSFADYLYWSLRNAGVVTFRDKEGMRGGNDISSELPKAIQNSAISIPIFSKGYAFRKWCLFELVEMVRCRKPRGHKIVPVFYDVEPSHVQNQTGSYEEAFRQHENFNNSHVENWKKALREVGAISGWEVKNTADGHQGQITKQIVQHILRELKANYLNVTGCLVGTEHHVLKILGLLDADSDHKSRIVGIHGIGGIGKTTLAKVVYNGLAERFESCSFLESIRDKDLKSLQEQLISDILRENDMKFSSCDHAISNIKKRFRSKKVLILLDDVDHCNQLENLAGSHDWFGMGSKILITTRIRSILCSPEVDYIYELETLNPELSLQLFSKHAFTKEKPPESHSALSKEFVSIVDGLPLALEVLGSSLRGKDISVWESRLKNLRNRPLKDVAEKLKISYDALSHEEQQMFLDIACLFLGMDIDIAIHMWSSPIYDPREGIDSLLDMSLIKIGDDSKLKMHDQLRDLGRDIVRNENVEEPLMRSRVWNIAEADDIVSNSKGTKEVKALSLDYPGCSLSIQNLSWPILYDTQLRQLPKLKFLNLHFSKLVGNFHQLLPKLRWLQWRGCPLIDAPSNFILENLVILDLSRSDVTESWNGWNEIKGEKLKVLNLTGCYGLKKTPKLSAYRNLERLILENCGCLVEIDKSIAELKNLAFLNLRNCQNLKMLPPELGHLNVLEDLLLDKRGIKILPDSIRLLVNLKNLSLRACWPLRKLPNWISALESLVELHLDFSDIEEVPDAIGALPRLQILGLRKCRRLQSVPALPSTITDLRFSWHGTRLKLPSSINLQELCGAEKSISLSEAVNLIFPELEILQFSNECVRTLLIEFATFTCLKQLTVNCGELQCISEFPPSLVLLQLDFCYKLEELPDLSTLKNLLKLSIGCGRMTKIHGLGGLERLQDLRVAHCYGLRSVPELPLSLSSLQIECCALLEELPDLSKLKNLLKLSIDGCGRMTQIHGLGGLELLMKLHVAHCGRLQRISELPSGLSSLRIDSCTLLEKVPDLSNLKNLLNVSIVFCDSMMEIHGIGGLERLQHLDVSHCGDLYKMDGIQQLECLKLLDIIGCNSLGLPDLSFMEKLIVRKEADMIDLVVRGSDEWVKIKSNISKYSKTIETLGFREADMISLPKEIYDFTRLTALELVSLGKLRSVHTLPSSLTVLRVKNCESIVEWPDLSNLKNLSELHLSGPCDSLTKIQGLAELESLTCLRLDGCRNLKTLSGLEQLKFLSDLFLYGCSSLEKLPSLSNLSKLESLQAFNCDRLGENEGHERLILKDFYVSGCLWKEY